MKLKKGFTLIELVVVIAIIGILLAVAIPRFSAYRQQASNSAIDKDAYHITLALASALADIHNTNLVNSQIGPIHASRQLNYIRRPGVDIGNNTQYYADITDTASLINHYVRGSNLDNTTYNVPPVILGIIPQNFGYSTGFRNFGIVLDRNGRIAIDTVYSNGVPVYFIDGVKQ